MTGRLRQLAVTAGICIALLGLTGCSAVAPAYQPSNDNTRALLKLSDRKVSMGAFTAKDPALNRISLRGGAFHSPFNDSWAEYLKAALRTELENAGKLDNASQVAISGELLENSLDAAIGTGTARISARIVVTRGRDKVFDKVVSGASTWDSSFMGAVAIPAAHQHYADTMKKLLAQLFADPDFQSAL